MTEPRQEYLPPRDPTRSEKPEPVLSEHWTPSHVIAGLMLVMVTATVCALVLHWAGVI